MLLIILIILPLYSIYSHPLRNNWKVEQHVCCKNINNILSQYPLEKKQINTIKSKLLSKFNTFKFEKDNEIVKTSLNSDIEHKTGAWEYSPYFLSFLTNDRNKPIGKLKFENYYKAKGQNGNIYFSLCYIIDVYKGQFNFGNFTLIPDRRGGQIWLSMHPIWPTQQFKIGTFFLEPDVGPLMFDSSSGALAEFVKRRSLRACCKFAESGQCG